MNVLLDTASMPRCQFFQERIMFPAIASRMSDPNILFGMRASTGRGDNMVEVDFMMGQDALFADIAPHAVTFKNTLEAYLAYSYLFLERTTTHLLLMLFQSMSFSPLSIMSAVALSHPIGILSIIGKKVWSPAFNALRVPSIAFRLIRAKCLKWLFAFTPNTPFIAERNFLATALSTNTSLLAERVLRITANLANAFAAKFTTLAFVELIKGFVLVALGTHLGKNKQGELNMIQFSHSYGPPRKVCGLEATSATNACGFALCTSIIAHLNEEVHRGLE